MATKERNWRTTKEVAEELEITERQVRNMCEQGKLHALRITHRWRIYDNAKDLKTAARKASFVLAAAALL